MRTFLGHSHYEDVNSNHIPEDVLDYYARRKLTEPAARCVEEHLLICDSCCDRLAKIDGLIAVLRYAVALQN